MFTNKQTCRLGKYFLIAILISLAGCMNYITGSQTTRPKHFDLIAPDISEEIKSENSQVFIMKPKVNQALSKEKIVVVSNDNEISYFKDWYWSDDLSSLIQTKIVEVFDNKNYFEGVGTLGQGVSTDYRIVSEIRAFQFEVREAGLNNRICQPNSVISRSNFSEYYSESNDSESNDENKIEFWTVAEISVKIIYDRKGKVVASKSFCAEVRVDDKKVELAVDGLNFVLGELLKTITEYTVKEVRVHIKNLDIEVKKKKARLEAELRTRLRDNCQCKENTDG